MIRFPLLLLLFLSSSVFATQIYKWVDENGQTQFSQFPPNNVDTNANKVDVKAQPASNPEAANRLKDMRQKLLESSVERNTESEKDKEDAEQAKRMAENCERAKQHVRDLENNGRIYKTLENGERHWYSEQERMEQIQKAKEQASRFCQ